MYRQVKLHLLETLAIIESGKPISVALITAQGPATRMSNIVDNAESLLLVGGLEWIKAKIISQVQVQPDIIADHQHRQLSVVKKDESP